jgi:hypothetical protein
MAVGGTTMTAPLKPPRPTIVRWKEGTAPRRTYAEPDYTLQWAFHDGLGRWNADSHWPDEETPFQWIICMTEEGRYSILESDSEVRSCDPRPFSTLHDAKKWCDTEEKLYRQTQ